MDEDRTEFIAARKYVRFITRRASSRSDFERYENLNSLINNTLMLALFVTMMKVQAK